MFFQEILVLFLGFCSYAEAFNFGILRGNDTDRLSLLAFKAEITSDPLGVLNSWNNSAHFCEWHGITCGRRHQRVTVLTLNSSQLAGGLSPHIGNLSFLRILNLENNSLSRLIPQQLGFLRRLQILGLQNNSFSGEIPTNISRCINLKGLDLGENKLTGELPWELGFLPKLKILSFHQNNISDELPSSLGNLSSLYAISGAQNNLTGAIPDSFGQLKKLSLLGLGENHLAGAIPSSLYNLSSLSVFSLPSNRLEGTLPPNLGYLLPNLEIFRVSTNLMEGMIPASISNASKILAIDFASNNFSRKIPSLMGLSNLVRATFHSNNLGNGEDNDLNFLFDLLNFSNLEVIAISDNNFGGVLPEYVSNFSTSVQTIAFATNQIRGRIPSGIGNLVGLYILGMEINHLTGSIPSSLGQLPMLGDLFLNENKLSGHIPASLGNLTSLWQINLSSNNLQGKIPSTLGKWRNLNFVALSLNKLSGTIPRDIMGISTNELYLSYNMLTGFIPVEVGKLVSLTILDLSNNRLSGEIPVTLQSCISLENLQLQGNMLQGIIPESLSSIRAIEIIDLSRNSLSGKIPEFLGGFRLLQNLNLSFNNFEGTVPTEGVFKNGTAVSLIGNEKLCGGMPVLKLPSCNSHAGKSKRQKSQAKKRIIIAVSSGMFCVGLLLVLLCLLAYYGSRKTRRAAASASSPGVSFPKIAYADLFKATNGFSSENLLGMGSFGSVFKGILHQTETLVAIKVLNLQQKGALKSFAAECEALRSIRHRNLLEILTVCSSIDFSGNDFKALVYEFMVNGSLEEWLHQSTDQYRYLNLIQRLNIAIDISSALEYLHNHCAQPIVHCDLKPSNVLLDSDMTACVGDFGLARFLPEASSHNRASSSGFKGSIGYAAPEYAMGSKASTQGDVYSFGILLLEMFTGKRPTDELFKDNFNLLEYVVMALPHQVTEVLDPVLLRGNGETNDNSGLNHGITKSDIIDCLVLVLRIGVSCSAKSPTERMNISNAVTELHRIRKNLLQCGIRQGSLSKLLARQSSCPSDTSLRRSSVRELEI